jgi:perosamine synthetase
VISAYENAFAAAVGTPYACAFWKGRVALYAILQALGIGPGDEVVLPGFTCVVVANSVSFTGAKPVFGDIDPNSYNLDPESVRQAITPRTKALIIQHTFGIPAEMDRLLEIARKHELAVIEDCAHALGSTYRGKKVGTFGDAAFFSSQWSKPFTTGLGGVAVTGDAEVASRLRQLQEEFRDPPRGKVVRLRAQYSVYNRFFKPSTYWLALNTLRRLSRLNLFVGSSGSEELNSKMPADVSWRMSRFQARVGLQRLDELSRNLSHRRRLGKFYDDSLRTRGWQLPPPSDSVDTVFLRYPVRVSNKWELLKEAQAARVELGSWFESVLHPIGSSLERFHYETGTCPVAERIAGEILNLPLHEGISIAEAKRIIDFVCHHAKLASRVGSRKTDSGIRVQKDAQGVGAIGATAR